MICYQLKGKIWIICEVKIKEIAERTGNDLLDKITWKKKIPFWVLEGGKNYFDSLALNSFWTISVQSYFPNISLVFWLFGIWKKHELMKRIWLPALSTQKIKTPPPLKHWTIQICWRNTSKILHLNICAEICVQKSKNSNTFCLPYPI